MQIVAQTSQRVCGYELLFLLRNHYLFQKAHLYEDFDYEAHFSHSKADFCEMLPDTLLFREYLFADSYSFRGQVHF